MRDNLVRFPKQHSRPELIDDLRVALRQFFSDQQPEGEMEMSLMATAVFHFLVASKVAMDHLGKQEESDLLMNAVRAIETNWPNYQPPLQTLMTDLENFCYY